MQMTLTKRSSAILALGTLIAFGAYVPLASAQAGPGMPPQGGAPKPPLREMRERQQQLREDMKSEKAELQEDRRAFREERLEVQEGIREDRRGFIGETIDDRKAMHAEVLNKLKDADTPAEKQDILKQAREDRAAFRQKTKTEAETLREDFRARRGEIKEDARALVGDRFSMIMRRLLNALERFDQILGRIDSRIGMLEDDDIDVTTAVAASAAASSAVDAASTAIAEAQSAIAIATSSDTPKDELDSVRAAVKAATEAVKNAHEAVKEALRALKEASPDDDGSTATTTPVE